MALIFALITKGFGIRGLAYAFVIRTLLANVLSAVVAYRKLSWLHLSPRRCSREAGSRLMSFGGVAQLQGLLAIALNSIERAIAAPLIGLDAAGLLDIGKKLPSMAASIPSAFASAFMPAAAYLHGGLAGTQEGREAIAKLYLKGARYMNLSAAYICGFLATSSVPILLVWMGKLYPGTALLLVLFSLSTQVHLMTGPGTSMLKGMGRLGQEFVYSLSNVAALAITLPASRVIVGSWTVVGIGCAVASATVISAIIFICWANHLLGIPARRYIEFVVIPGLVPYPGRNDFRDPGLLLRGAYHPLGGCGPDAGDRRVVFNCARSSSQPERPRARRALLVWRGDSTAPGLVNSRFARR